MLTALTLATVLAGQAAPSPTPAPAPSLAADLSATPSPDCGGLRDNAADGLAMHCVTAPLERISYLALTYAAGAQQRGWVRLRNASTILWMQKPEAAGTCDRLTISVFWNTALAPVPDANTPAYLGVANQPGQPCEPLTSATTTP